MRLGLACELKLGLRWGRGGSRGCRWCFDGRRSAWALVLHWWEAERIRESEFVLRAGAPLRAS